MSSPEGNPPLPDVGRCPDFFNMKNPCQGYVLEDFNTAGEHTGELICSRDDCQLKPNEGGGAKAEAPDGPLPHDRESFRHSLVDENHLFPRQDNPDNTSSEVFGAAILDTTKGADGTFNVVSAETHLKGLLRHAGEAYKAYLRRVEAQNENPDPSVTQIPLKEVTTGDNPPQVKILNDLSNVTPKRIDELGIQPYLFPQRRLSTFEILEKLLGGKKADEASESNPPLSLGAQIKQERDEEVGVLRKIANGEPTDLPESFSIPPEALIWPKPVDNGFEEHRSDLNATPPPFQGEGHGVPLPLDGSSQSAPLTAAERRVLDPNWATSEDGSHLEKRVPPVTTTKGFGYVKMAEEPPVSPSGSAGMSGGTGVPPEVLGQYVEERSRTINPTGEEA